MAASCLFCQSAGPFTTEHVIPESLGNDDLLLRDQVCGACNNHFSKLEEIVLQKTPIAFWRAQLGIRTKRGKLPSVDLSQPRREKGTIPSTHPAHDDVRITAHGDSTSIEFGNERAIAEILSGERTEFRLVVTPRMLFVLGRFMCKVGLELLCLHDEDTARSQRFDAARRYARFGNHGNLWPLFHFREGRRPSDIIHKHEGESGSVEEEVECYTYSLLHIGDHIVVARLGVGTDNWIVCLTEQYPTPEIRSGFPGRDLNCIWYSPEQCSAR